MPSGEERLDFVFDPSSCRAVATKSPLTDELYERWYGKYHGDTLVLDLVEVAYLLSTGRIIVKDGDREVKTLQELVSIHGACFDASFWPMLSVFKDLRERGRRVRVLAPMRFLVRDKTGELRLVYVLEEKYPVKISNLVELINEAKRNNLKATFAIVSLQGELTYYDSIPADIRVERVERV
jgi:tRNA-intron endonuclease